MYANCDEAGRDIFVSGVSVWKSRHGYLPGELFGFMYFYVAATVVYFIMLIWVCQALVRLYSHTTNYDITFKVWNIHVC
jgi:hypothetical protein